MHVVNVNLNPRQMRILEILLGGSKPVLVDSLSKTLSTSRRTVFRELEALEYFLQKIDASLHTSNKGISIECQNEQLHAELKTMLNEAGREDNSFLPVNKAERHLALIFELFSNLGTIQKLFLYADNLHVSESTISNDLDEIEDMLAIFAVRILRKSGQGVFVHGNEDDVRSAICVLAYTRFSQNNNNDLVLKIIDRYIGFEIESCVDAVMLQCEKKLNWISSESLEMLKFYLMISVLRIRHNFFSTGRNINAGSFQKQLAIYIAGKLEQQCSILFSEDECASLAVQIQSCRAKIYNPADISEDKTKLIEEMVFKMIRLFDPKLSANLETNEQLVDGLRQHLGPAISRLEQKIELQDPLNGQIALWYPELYEKSRRASSVLEDFLKMPISESEVSFIATHFSAAYFSMDEKNVRKKILRACLICVSGIGVSYMLASQIRTHFKGELDLDISSTDDEDAFEYFDFLISTIPLKTELPVVQVGAMLSEDDYKKIQNFIANNAYIKKDIVVQNKNKSFSDILENTETLLGEVKKLHNNFGIYNINADCTFDELAKFAASLCKNSGNIYMALKKRENLSTQVIAPLKIVLLHTRVSGINGAIFAVISPKGGFSNGYFNGAATCVLMLLPQDSSPVMTAIMGSFSAALVDNSYFLEAVQNANENAIRSVFEAEIAETLSTNLKTMFLAG
ncbi:MAG: hypothetical protein Ta2F_04620 [Termitinemataceae bacterium]|nr:MAG: hypothetical protein Ta2F_04620 [Termitinemataceae bacterium]